MPAHAGNQRLHFEFALWASSLGRLPSINEVEGFFQVSRQSAWRIHRNWMKALQTDQARRQPAPLKPVSRTPQ